jgi:Cytochrome c oxidase subunit VIa.
MSFLRLKNLQQVRRLATNFVAEQKAIEHHAKETAVQWKWISMLVGVPVCGYLFIKHIVLEQHEDAHGEHVEYDHMRIRKTQFPWGEESLFHSKHNYSPNAQNAQDESSEKVVKEPIITRWIRTLQENSKARDDIIFKSFVTECHQKMMEHIESKKFPEYPVHTPSYNRMFGRRKIDLSDPSTQLPNTFDD